MRDDFLGHTVGRGGIGHQLRVAGVIQTGEEKGCFVDGVAHCQQSSDFNFLISVQGIVYSIVGSVGAYPWFCRMQATLSLPRAFAIWAPSS